MVREIIVKKPFNMEEFMKDNYDALDDMEFVKSIKREAKKETFDEILIKIENTIQKLINENGAGNLVPVSYVGDTIISALSNNIEKTKEE